MELDDFKTTWQNAGTASHSITDLQGMTKLKHHPTLKKIRVKLMIETIGLVFFLLVYYDWFDGDKKPWIANALLVTAGILYILNDVISYIALLKPVRGINLKESLQQYLARIKMLSIISVMVSFTYGICLILFFSSVIIFTNEKKFLITGLTGFLLIMTFLSYKIWGRWMKQLKEQVAGFE